MDRTIKGVAQQETGIVLARLGGGRTSAPSASISAAGRHLEPPPGANSEPQSSSATTPRWCRCRAVFAPTLSPARPISADSEATTLELRASKVVVAPAPRMGPNSAEVGGYLADLGPNIGRTRLSPKANFGRRCPNFSRSWPYLGRTRPQL